MLLSCVITVDKSTLKKEKPFIFCGKMSSKKQQAYDFTATLWENNDENFFRDRIFHPIQQYGPRCVATTLAMLTGKKPEDFQGKINTQNPCSWSQALNSDGMKFAYCPTDVRKLKFYMNELVALDDLFTISYYTSTCSEAILADPDRNGWITGSHIVILHRDQIFDPATGTKTPASEHHCNEYHTKRIFRIVPVNHLRGL